MNLIIDIGNTNCKLGIYSNKSQHFIRIMSITHTQNIIAYIESLLNEHPNIKNVILSSVKGTENELKKFLERKADRFIDFSCHTPIPIKNCYNTKDTLGIDRLAAAVGANNIFPKTNVLIVDTGTAVTFDFVNTDNQFKGGTISPGLNIRFKSLNSYTGKLPLITDYLNHPSASTIGIIADNTLDAVFWGCVNGLTYEIDSYIANYKALYSSLQLILTGGDCFFFEKRIKNSIFVAPNLILDGLNRILEYNLRC